MSYSTIESTTAQDFVTKLLAFEQSVQTAEVIDYRVPQLDSAGQIVGNLTPQSDGPQAARRELVRYFVAFGSPINIQLKVMRLSDSKLSDWSSFDEAAAFGKAAM